MRTWSTAKLLDSKNDPTDLPLTPVDGRGQDECERDGERDRHEDGLCPVQNGDDKHAAGERQPELHGFQRVVHVRAPFLRRAAADAPTPALRVAAVSAVLDRSAGSAAPVSYVSGPLAIFHAPVF